MSEGLSDEGSPAKPRDRPRFSASVRSDADTNATSNTAGPVRFTVNCPDPSVLKSASAATIAAGKTPSYVIGAVLATDVPRGSSPSS